MSDEFSHEEENLGKVYDHRLMKRLLYYVKPYKKWVFVGLGFSVLVATLNVIPNIIVKRVIDGPVAASDFNGVITYSILFAVVVALNFIFMYSNLYLMTWLGQNVMRDLRLDLFQHIQKQRLTFFDKQPVGRLMTRMTSDVQALQEIVSSGLVNVVQDMLILVALMSAAFYINFQLACVVFMVLPLLIGSVFFFSGKLRNAFRETRLSTSRMNSFLQEGITGMRVIQAFGAEERSQEQHIGHARKLRDAHLGTVVWFGLFWPTVDLVMAISIVLLAWWATGMAASGTVEVGVLVFFILSIDRFFWPIRDLAEKYNLFQSAMASAERIFRIFDTIELIEEKPELQLSTQDAAVAKPICFEEGIKFEDIWFAYKGEDWVIKGVNLEIKKGEHVAIVGSTGSGKTTITNLLPRFYDIQKGRITIDGKDSRDFSVPSLRALFAHVQQDVFLFAGDIASNIKLSKEMTDDEVWQVAKHVNADKFIRNFDDGLAHEVRERGGTFSAGERQLISFARALAFDPQILILDEATSNIDTETELLIQDALTKLMENRTAIVIAHRLSTIQHADKIVVLHHGKIAEQGKHQDLLAQDGIYRKLYELQMHEEERSHAPSSPGGDLVPNPA